MRRREVVAGLAAAVVSPTVKAQPAPLVGFLHSGSPAPNRAQREAFRSGLAEAGFTEGRNVMVEERWAESDLTRLPALAAELVARPVSVLATGGANCLCVRPSAPPPRSQLSRRLEATRSPPGTWPASRVRAAT